MSRLPDLRTLRCKPAALSRDGLYALNIIFEPVTHRNRVLIDRRSLKVLLLALTIAGVTAPRAAHAQSNAAEGQKIAFDRAKGNCLSCHEIAGGDQPGSIGPPLRDIKNKYPDRADLVAILTDETRRNPSTAMPPFGRNRILTEQEINAIVDFLQTL
jgi:sulfur-oxidizing protein SoxX